MIPIVFSTDDGYAMPTSVAIKSIVDTTSSDYLDFVILYKDSLNDISKTILSFAAQSEKKHINISYIDVGERLTLAKSHIGHITAATYYRILLPLLLPDCDKCIYLDGDVIVSDDISKLAEIELTSSEYIAGVSTIMIQLSSKKTQETRMNKIGIPDFNKYINAGVLIMNLKSLRENNCINKMIDLVPCDYPVQDQDILNVVCYGHIKILPPRYNVLPSIYHMSLRKLRHVYSYEDIVDARNFPCVIHYANKIKPWRYVNVKQGERWRQTYNELFYQIRINSDHYSVFNRLSALLKRVLYRIKCI